MWVGAGREVRADGIGLNVIELPSLKVGMPLGVMSPQVFADGLARDGEFPGEILRCHHSGGHAEKYLST